MAVFPTFSWWFLPPVSHCVRQKGTSPIQAVSSVALHPAMECPPLSFPKPACFKFRCSQTVSLFCLSSGLVILATRASSSRSTFPLQAPQCSRQSFTTVGLDEASRFSVRQSIVNRFALRERCSCVPFPDKSWLVKGCSCFCNDLFECFALGWWEECLCLFTQGRCCCTEARGLRVMPFCTKGGGKAL